MAPLTLHLYRALGTLALAPALAVPVFKGRFGTRWNDRLGFTLCGGGHPLWLHGASVGEAGGNLALLSALRWLGYQGPVLLTSATPAGLSFLESHLPNITKGASSTGLTQIAAPPLDFLGAPGRFLDRLDPRALLVLETEIWPELFFQCQERSIPILLLSARLSQRSYLRLSRFKGFIGQVLSAPALLAAISQDDLNRLVDLGLDPNSAAVIGSPKFDRLILQAQEKLQNLSAELNMDLSDEANLSGPFPAQPKLDRPVILAGSTHPGEEALIISAVKALPSPGASLAIAPRHLVRLPEVISIIKASGLTPVLYSETGSLKTDPHSVMVIDQMGLLSTLYSCCDLALVGGSFFDGAGHNPLEPVASGKPVIFGPSMSSFVSQAKGLQSVGAATAAPSALLPKAISDYLANPERTFRAGLMGLRHLSKQRPVAPILAQIVLKFLSEPPPEGPEKALSYMRSQAGTDPVDCHLVQ